MDGDVRAAFVARTRLQTGLAAIQTVSVHPGQTLTVRIGQSAQHCRQVVTADLRWVTVNFVDEQLVLATVDRMPGYL